MDSETNSKIDYHSIMPKQIPKLNFRHYNLCTEKNGELGAAQPNIYMSPALLAPTWFWHARTDAEAVFTSNYRDNR
jgi:hypothetical protein